MLYELMAFLAGDGLVGPVEPEAGLVVVKFIRRPFLKGMAKGTIRGALTIELAVMHIFVTCSARIPQPRKLLYGGTIRIPVEMAGPARLTLMGPQQFELRPGMIKFNVTPAALAVAAFTACLGVVFFIEVRLVDVFMAVDAAHADVPETPLFLLFMADKTGCGLVGPLQREGARVVLLQGIQ